MRNLIPFLVLILLSGCDGSSEKTPEQIQAEIAANQKNFEQERQLIEAENRAREEKIARQRSFVSATFVSVDSDRLEVLLSNNTEKSIDNQSGSLEVLDADGNYVTGIALTNWVPGSSNSSRIRKPSDMPTRKKVNMAVAYISPIFL